MVGNVSDCSFGLGVSHRPSIDCGLFTVGIAAMICLCPRRDRRQVKVPCPAFGGTETDDEGDHHHPAILRQSFQHAVRHVTRMRRYRARIAVREQDRRSAFVEHIVHCRF